MLSNFILIGLTRTCSSQRCVRLPFSFVPCLILQPTYSHWKTICRIKARSPLNKEPSRRKSENKENDRSWTKAKAKRESARRKENWEKWWNFLWTQWIGLHLSTTKFSAIFALFSNLYQFHELLVDDFSQSTNKSRRRCDKDKKSHHAK